MGSNWGNQQDEYHRKVPWWWNFYLIWLYLKGGMWFWRWLRAGDGRLS